MELARGERDVQQSITIVLSTPIGERRMRPTFGCAVHDLVFSPNSATTHGLIRQHVFEALTLWEPRIEVRAIDVGVDPDEPGCVLVDVHYALRATNELRNLVYPFYLIPEEPQA
jgi:phage baseplate assembly protein W